MTDDQHTGSLGGSLGTALLPDLSVAPYADALGDHPVQFPHGLADDPRFSPASMAELVPRLPSSWVLSHEAQYSHHEVRGRCALPDDTDLGRVLRELPTSTSSIRAYNLEHTTDFRPLLDELEPQVRGFVGAREGGLTEVNLAAFFASAGAVTPAHPDRHHNLLLNVSGRKEVWIERDPDARRRHSRALDYFRAPHLGAPALPPAVSFVLEPGEGVYIPPYAFHWTTVLGDAATGFSVGFSTPTTVRNSRVVDFDARLRRVGVHPRPLDMHGTGGVTARAKARMSPVLARVLALRPGR